MLATTWFGQKPRVAWEIGGALRPDAVHAGRGIFEAPDAVDNWSWVWRPSAEVPLGLRWLPRLGTCSESHRVAAMLDRLDCPPRDALVEKLSGGERRRVALARALQGAPEILLLVQAV